MHVGVVSPFHVHSILNWDASCILQASVAERVVEPAILCTKTCCTVTGVIIVRLWNGQNQVRDLNAFVKILYARYFHPKYFNLLADWAYYWDTWDTFQFSFVSIVSLETVPESSIESWIICAGTDLPYVSAATAVCRLQRANLQSTFCKMGDGQYFVLPNAVSECRSSEICDWASILKALSLLELFSER